MSVPQARRGSRLGGTALRFYFDGRPYSAIEGDTAASALLANGVRVLGRSVKCRRPRGLLTLGPEEPNALLTVGVEPTPVPNVPAPRLRLAPGLSLRSQNRWPTLRHDLLSIVGLGGGLLGAGFYYKTFMWPSWRAYEGIIRRLAGLGPAPQRCNLGAACVEHIDCDVLIAGAGAAGLAAALAAMRSGARVALCEREPVCGGELEFEQATIDERPSQGWIAAALEDLAAGGARVLTEAALVGGSEGQFVAHREPGGCASGGTVFRIEARALVIAMGALERSIAFIDNDRPGAMLLGAAERLLACYGVRAGERVVLFGNHDRLYPAARRLLAGGIQIAAIVDTRPYGGGLKTDDLIAVGVECLTGSAVVRALGSPEVHTALIAQSEYPGSLRRIACDAILVSGGWTPALQAGLQDGAAARHDGASATFVATGGPAWRISCGAANGCLTLEQVLADGHRAGLAAALRAGCTGGAVRMPVGRGDPDARLVPFWRSPADPAEERHQFVDLQNDVTVADLRQALAEGFRDIEHVKRYTTLGVGTERGRTSVELGAAIVAELSGRTLADVGLSRSRPPFQPATLALLCGERHGPALRPQRRTPLHEWHLAHGGVIESMGLWMRPRYYRANGANPAAAGVAEAARVRSLGGILDGSTLGKIEVAGADAAAFLDRLYLTRASTLTVGRARYMVLLREDGMVLDDGIVLRLAEDRFIATASSGHAAEVLSHLEFWRAREFSDRSVTVTDVTEAWAVVVVAGPRSRDALCAVLGEPWQADLDRLKHMDFAAGRWQGAQLRVLRASFSGELAFELHGRPGIALPLWEGLLKAGLAPYGLEALDILRIEKGYLASAELNGQATPADLGLQTMLKAGNACVGRELLDRAGLTEGSRPRLIGLQASDGRARFLGGAQLTLPAESEHACGHVTSTAYSPALGQWLGLGFAARSLAPGAELVARDPLRGLETRVRVTAPVHFDPTGERMRA